VNIHDCVVDGVFEDVDHFHRATLEQPLAADSFQPERAGQAKGMGGRLPFSMMI
jgi:hypothetical protein